MVSAYHKSVKDFLLGNIDNQASLSGHHLAWQTSEVAAHAVFVDRVVPAFEAITMQHFEDKCSCQLLPGCPAGQGYCLAYVVDHICMAQDWPSLYRLCRHLPALKALLETPGQIYKLIKALTDACGALPDKGASNLTWLYVCLHLRVNIHMGFWMSDNSISIYLYRLYYIDIASKLV